MSGASTSIKSIFKFEFVWSMCVCCVWVFLAISVCSERRTKTIAPTAVCDYNNQNRRHGEREKNNMYTKEAIVFKADGVPLYFTSAPKGNEIKQSMRKMFAIAFFLDSLRCCVFLLFELFCFRTAQRKSVWNVSEMITRCMMTIEHTIFHSKAFEMQTAAAAAVVVVVAVVCMCICAYSE